MLIPIAELLPADFAQANVPYKLYPHFNRERWPMVPSARLNGVRLTVFSDSAAWTTFDLFYNAGELVREPSTCRIMRNVRLEPYDHLPIPISWSFTRPGSYLMVATSLASVHRVLLEALL